MCFEGDRVIWKVLAEYSWSPSTARSGSFLCTAASSTPIWVVTKRVRYIHELSLTLEHSMPISSPAVPGLTGLATPAIGLHLSHRLEENTARGGLATSATALHVTDLFQKSP